MNWLTRIFSGSATELVKEAGEAVAKVSAGHLGEKELTLKLEELVAKRDENLLTEVVAEIQAKEKIMVAELTQEDALTKRARPAIIYVGLAAIIADGIGSLDFSLPAEFWYVWGAVCGTYVIGRSAEKLGSAGSVVAAVTGGSKKTDPPSILQ